MDTILLTTKLKWPPLTPDLVPRPRLIAQLQAHSERGLTLVSAPAGYGKTTLLCEWCHLMSLDGRGHIAWVSVDENDNDLNLFLRYVVAALQAHFPNAFEELLATLKSKTRLPVELLAALLANQLDELGERVILIMDDYHVIQDTNIHAFLTTLVLNLPSNLHMVFSSRIDPVLPLGRARAQGNLVELRAADLRFTSEETQTFFELAAPNVVDPSALTLLDQRMEGWPAGLRLASLTLDHPSTLQNLNVTIHGDERLMNDYLMGQVLAQQSEKVQTFLFSTSLVDRFCVPLCESMLEDTTGQARALMDHIQHANLLLVALDDEGNWFRYHHLFQEWLGKRALVKLDKVHIAKLLERASQWFETNELYEEALRYALAAGRSQQVARLIETHAHSFLNRDDWRTVERWLGQVPVPVAASRPLLKMIKAWLDLIAWKFEAIPSQLDDVESAIAQGDIEPTVEPLVRGYYYTLRAYAAYWRARFEDTIRFSQLALETLPPSHRFLRGLDYMHHALALRAMGKKQEALELLDRTLEQDGYRPDQFTMWLMFGQFTIRLLENELHPMLRLAEHLSGLAQKGNQLASALWSHNLTARAYYEWNQLNLALTHFSRAVESRHVGNLRGVHNTMVGLAVTYQALGKTEQALELAASAHQVAMENGLPTLHLLSVSLEARLALMRSDMETASQRAGMIPVEFTRNSFAFIEIPELTKLQFLIAEGSPSNLRAAEQLYQTLTEFCAESYDKYHGTTMLALGALLQEAQGERTAALATLQAAIEASRAAHRIRTFVDLGAPLFTLLRELAAQVPDDKFIGQILAAFGAPEPFDSKSPRTRQEGRLAAAVPMPEPLTMRELQVLEMLRGPLSAKEIAQLLVISPLTLKRHTSNIYAKLGVNNRRAAVAAGLEMGVIAS